MRYLITTMFGLILDMFVRRLRIVRPLLPDFIHHLAVRHLHVGQTDAHLNFERGPSGKMEVHVLQIDGHLDVVTEGFEDER